MKCLLFPTDFSPNAAHALQFAIDFAAKTSAKLVIMHSYKIPYDFSSRVAQELETEKVEAESKLESLRAELLTHPHHDRLECECLALPGDPLSSIKKAATDLNADLIIMGAKGNSGIKHQIFGSITAECILLTRFPVLAIPEEATFENMSRIVYTTDYDENDFDNLENVVAVAKLFDAEVRILHIVEKDTLKEKIMFEGFKAMVSQKKLYQHIHHNMIAGNDFYDTLNRYITECKGSMLVMTSNRKSWIAKLFSKSLTHDMVYHTHVPFLALKPDSVI